MTTPERPAAIWTFFALTFGWTWGLWAIFLWIGGETSALSGALFVASAFGPGIAAFATVWAFEGRTGLRSWLSRCLTMRLGWRWYALALFAPPFLMLMALGIHIALGGTMPDSTVQGTALIVVAKFALVIILGGPLGEEFGWRGCALPALSARLGWRWAAIMVGVVWGLWHLPLFWMPGTAQSDLPMGLFLASTVALSVVFARLSVNTGFGVLPAILLHGSINWSSMVVPVMPNGGDGRPYMIVMILLILIAVVMIVKPGPHPPKGSVPP